MKTWIKTNLSKITLALTGAVSGVTGSIVHHKTNNLTYFLNSNYTVTCWATIWSEKISGKQKIHLYFDTIKQNDDDVVWDGKYPEILLKSIVETHSASLFPLQVHVGRSPIKNINRLSKDILLQNIIKIMFF